MSQSDISIYGLTLQTLITVRNEVAKVMFIHVSVILYKRGWGRFCSRLRCLFQGVPAPGRGSSAPGGACSGGCACSRGILLLGMCGELPLLQEMAATADGMHPTRIHSCFYIIFSLMQHTGCLTYIPVLISVPKQKMWCFYFLKTNATLI